MVKAKEMSDLSVENTDKLPPLPVKGKKQTMEATTIRTNGLMYDVTSRPSSPSVGPNGIRLRKSAQVVPSNGATTGAESEMGESTPSDMLSSTNGLRRSNMPVRSTGPRRVGSTIVMEVKKPKIHFLKRWKTEPMFGSGSQTDAEQRAFTCIMLMATLFALWGTDIYELCGPPAIYQDNILYTISTLVFICFLTELVFYTLFRPGYTLSFFFFLDLIATLSLLPDVLVLWGIEVFATGGSDNDRALAVASTGTRAARVVRLFKLFSLLKRNEIDSSGKKSENSKIGTILTDRTTLKVLVIVAAMLISSNLLDIIGEAKAFAEITSTARLQLNQLEALMVHDNETTSNYMSNGLLLTIVSKVIRDLNAVAPGTPSSIIPGQCPNVTVDLIMSGIGPFVDTTPCVVRYLSVNGVDLWGSASSGNDLRRQPSEISIEYSDSGNTELQTAVISTATSTALSNIVLIVFVAILLGVSQFLIINDARRLVIAPLETMAGFVRHLQKDPLHPMVLSQKARATLEAETKLVVDAMMKLSHMLQVGFGDAGASVIQRNMLNKSQKIDPVAPGKRIQGIYVFCDIRNFTDCTECLQTDVMVFVNRIACFVHQAVVDNHGSPNKNIGDAFLLVWSLPERKWGAKEDESKVVIYHADRALEAVIRIIIVCAHDRQLQELTNRPAVQARIPGYATRMGFGIHLGWGIEGAIGSILKIDATYLSPNVNMSSRLEGATKQYGCGILMTDAFYDALTTPVQALCRRIDRVTARGSNIPFDLYTYDAPRFANTELLLTGTDVWTRFPPTTTDDFRDLFQDGVKLYIAGDWAGAHEKFKWCLEMNETDGPTRMLTELIEKNDRKAPPSWSGYRKDGVD